MLKKVLTVFFICLCVIITGCDNQNTKKADTQSPLPIKGEVNFESSASNNDILEENNQDDKEKRVNDDRPQIPIHTNSSDNNDIRSDSKNQETKKEENGNETSNKNESIVIQPSHNTNTSQITHNDNNSSVGNSEPKQTKICPESFFKAKAEAVAYGESHMKYDTSFSVIDYVDECGKMYYELDITFRIQTPGYPKTIDETQVMSFNWNKYDEDTMKYYINNDCSIDVSMSYFGKSEKQKLIEYYNNGYFTKDSKPECYSEIEHELN